MSCPLCETVHGSKELTGKALRCEGIEKRLAVTNCNCLQLLMESIDMNTLLPHLMAKNLVPFHFELVYSNQRYTNGDRVRAFFRELESCGERNAFELLLECLEEEREHPPHRQCLVHLKPGFVLKPQTPYPSSMCGRKRKGRADEDEVRKTVVKRHPDAVIRPEGELASDKYCMVMAAIQEHHYYGNWKEANELVEKYHHTQYDYFYLAAKLRNYSCHVVTTHMSFHTIERDIQDILRWCAGKYTNNSRIIESKCHWVLAKGTRYRKEMKKASNHILAAMELQHMFGPGEDIACSSYCHASILNQQLSQEHSPDLYKKVKALYQKAVAYVQLDPLNFGLPVFHPVIRLAQVCLNCTPHTAGMCSNKEEIKEAEGLLKSIQGHSDLLKNRLTCLYFIAKSDLYRNMCDAMYAEMFARRAEDIARDNDFEAETRTIASRLEALGLQLRVVT